MYDTVSTNTEKLYKLLQLCKARAGWSDAVVRPARVCPFRLMYFPDGDPIDQLRMIHRQASYGSVDLIKDIGVTRSLPIDGDQ